MFPEAQEQRNERALAVYNRVQNKLTGAYDATITMMITLLTFSKNVPVADNETLDSQVETLILT